MPLVGRRLKLLRSLFCGFWTQVHKFCAVSIAGRRNVVPHQYSAQGPLELQDIRVIVPSSSTSNLVEEELNVILREFVGEDIFVGMWLCEKITGDVSQWFCGSCKSNYRCFATPWSQQPSLRIVEGHQVVVCVIQILLPLTRVICRQSSFRSLTMDQLIVWAAIRTFILCFEKLMWALESLFPKTNPSSSCRALRDSIYCH